MILSLSLLLAAPVGAQETRLGAEALESLARDQDDVVRKVGEVELRASDVFRALDLAAPGVSAEVMREMVLATLAQLEARREGIDVPARAVDQGVETALAEHRASFAMEVDTEATLEQFLQQQHGMSPEEFRAEVRRRVLSALMLERVVRLHLLRLPRDELQIILLDDAQRAQEVGELLEQGASFSVLARRHSIHPSGPDGGFMPPLPRDLELPVVEGRERLQPGEWLGPAPISVEGQNLWRVVRVVDRMPPEEAPWAELRARIEEDLRKTPVHVDELAIFEANMLDRYRVERPERSP